MKSFFTVLIILIFFLQTAYSQIYVGTAQFTLDNPSGNMWELKVDPNANVPSTDIFTGLHFTIRYNSNSLGSLSFIMGSTYFTGSSVSMAGSGTDPNDADYTLVQFDMVYAPASYSAGTKIGGSGWSSSSEYTLCDFTVTGVSSGDLQLASDNSSYVDAYAYLETWDGVDVYDYTDYVTTFYGGSSTTPNGWLVEGFNGTLPVHLISFNVYAEGNNAQASWSTAMELNNKGFYLERSKDLKNWEVAAFVPTQAANGNSFSQLNYNYTDQNVYQPWMGVSVFYYRLRQQDYNGTEEYVGKIFAVRFGVQAGAGVTVYPLPASDMVTITAPASGDYLLRIIDLMGQPVFESHFRGSKAVDVTTFNSGNYSAVVTSLDGTFTETQRIVVSR